MEGKKQTAVEWLEEKMTISGFLTPKSFYEQAKEIDKERLKEAFEANNLTVGHGSKYVDFEHYYQVNYGK